ncbi:thiol reductant ABC exporter subunit CydC [Amycolatopsis endophytica]|uniref:ATP-binding cassette subfamily C protein CydD/ATP-binding cassette subfamily C protein CydCD n=1 Tax=Amycolatopsis endophytica TaxID=860233 RepID=A0A853B0G5_9PSEU|nr:thiol reductant ABC exporter subunit CydD [Amycolatopsis endophytica]NYI88281.1 ATP-binding cassette subfamily C protein CydD/ATP-binding cassette subfamily C protein CydCD [Amycolatopsis endophytica]
MDTMRPGKGPLGALPLLSAAARRALALSGLLALGNAAALVAQAFLLASVCAAVVSESAVPTGALIALAGVVVARALIAWALRVVAARAAAGAKEELRAKVVDHAMRLGPEWIARRGPGELTALTTRGLDALDAYFTDYLPALVTAAVVPLGAGAAVLFADWPSAVIIALTVPLLPLFAILVGKYTADRSAAAADALHRMSGHLLELVRALPVLAAFRRADTQAEAVRRVSEQHRRTTLRTLRVAFSSAFVLELAATLSVALVAVAIGMRLVGGDLPLAIGLGVLILAPECYQPLRAVGAAFHASEDGVEAVRRVADVLAEPVTPDGTAIPSRGEVRVEGLRVARRGGFAPDGETFTLRPGAVTRLRSRSGAGKSTTLAVLLGFVRPSQGEVLVDGLPLSEVDVTAFRRDIAWVPQNPVFTGGTVRGELSLDGEPDPVEVDALLHELNLAGLADVPVHELSTGQRQRVAVARALLRVRHGAWLLLLDEPSAHQDATNAALVEAAIHSTLPLGTAVLLAAHDREAHLPGVPAEPAQPHTPATTDSRRQSLRGVVSGRLFGGAGVGALALLAGVALTATSGWLIAKASQQPPILTLTVAVVGVRAFGLGRAALRYLERLLTHDAAFRIAGQLRVRLWRGLVRLGPARTLGLRFGEGQRRLVADVDTVRDLLPRVVTPPLIAVLVLAGAVAVQTVLLPAAGLVLAVAVLIGAFAAPALALRLERHATTALAEGRRTVSAQVLGLVESAAELIVFGPRRRRAELARADERLAHQARRQAYGAGAADALITLVTGFAAVAGIGLAARSGIEPVLAPVLALVPLALAEVLATLPPVAQHWDPLRTSMARIADVEKSEPLPVASHGPIAFEHADLGWTTPVLRDVDLRIPEGAHVAVVGPSGAGKSTLLAALLGFLPARSGRVTTAASVAWAPQEPQLVSTTVAENLRLADPHADDDRLREALRLACLDIPLDTVLGGAGSGLSGGQAQRLAVARALVAAPGADLVLLDEPTAHLDEPTARELLANLRTALSGKTVVHVTHHPVAADLVLDVGDGQVRARMPVLEGGYA